jgi:hypothetical protein
VDAFSQFNKSERREGGRGENTPLQLARLEMGERAGEAEDLKQPRREVMKGTGQAGKSFEARESEEKEEEEERKEARLSVSEATVQHGRERKRITSKDEQPG